MAKVRGVPVKLSERDEELGLLRGLYKGCVAGKGALVIVNGPVGCGKTALVRTFAEHVTRQEGAFLSVTGSASESLDRLGLIDQLVTAMHAAGPADGPSAVAEGAEVAAAAEASGRVPRALMQRIYQAVAELAGRGPLVLHADDVHFADEASLQCLRYLVRRIDSLAVLVVLTESSSHDRALATLHAETLHLPNCHRIRLGLLTVDGVAGYLKEHPATRSVVPETVELWARTSGGNPLLLDALIDDLAERGTVETAGQGAPVPGESFRNALLRCLHRCEPTLLAVARAAAVLGESVTPALIGGLLGADATSVRWSITCLRAAGLFSGPWFGHEPARLTVLADIPGKDLSALRARAAELLRESGAPAATVAAQLLATHDSAKAAWQLDILREAAREALDAGDIGAGVDYLRHASVICTDAQQEAEVIAALAEAQWRLDPAKASRYLPQLGRMVRAGLLTGSDALVVVKQRVWRGEFAQADDLLRIIEAREGADASDAWHQAGYPPAVIRSDHTLVRVWLSFCCPGLRYGAKPTTPTEAEADLSAGRLPRMSPRTFLTLSADLVGLEKDRTADQLLRGTGIASPFADALVALIFLIGAQRLDEAVLSSERLLDEPRNRRVPLGRALLETIRAAAALGRGDVSDASEAAGTALSLVSPEAWGIAIGLPLALAIRAATESGDVDTARTYLDLPVPMVMFGTPFVLPYRHALGRFRLALGRPRAALRDFESCGELMAKWQLDFPELVDWRNDTAAALIAMGDRQRARERVEDHLSRLGERPSRARGIALRHLAAVGAPRHRLQLLEEAVRTLDACGDGLELGRARADAHAALRAQGQTAAPESTDPLAVLWDAPFPPARGEVRTGGTDPNAVSAPLTELTEAELRVGALAAFGCTNREIADRLSITVSTVEQHLTKIYRKLKVRGRADLPPSIVHLSESFCRPYGR
ncbi:AAA family ATPase [Streptomyces sp. NPDC056462]|uniref:helix-turn-helix transcriptional regulator n=1 Tax=Streptomyces sp. NPDC056462 TaxID=3345826 RepID=UPI0036B26986